MPLSINTITTIVDANTLGVYDSADNPVTMDVRMTVQSSYVVRMTVYDYMSKLGNVAKSFLADDRFFAVLGEPMWSTPPLVSVANSWFNSVTDWSSVSPTTGLVCFKINLNEISLLTDLSGEVSKDYTLQVWCVDNSTGEPYLVSSSIVTVDNVTVQI